MHAAGSVRAALALRVAVLAAVAACACGLLPTNHGTPPALPALCDLSGFAFAAHDGKGRGERLPGAFGGCDAVTMASSDSGGMAGGFALSATVAAPARRRVNVSFYVRTSDLVPTPGGPQAGAATLTGGVYLHFFDKDGDSGAWNPQFGALAPSSTAGQLVRREASFVVPTTAATMRVHLAFGAHTDSYSPNRMLGGRATGNATLGNLTMVDAGPAEPLPPTLEVPAAVLQGAIAQAFDCLHNAQQSGNFTVGAGYTISGNISPDLTFGLHGVRRTAHPGYLAQMQRQWAWHSPSAATGEYTVGRVMGQINWPLGVDQIFSFTGDEAYLAAALPLVDSSLAYVNAHRDARGLATLVPVGKGRVGGGADWVDWYPTRLQGITFQFHLWWVRTLDRFASLHLEFAGSFGNATRARAYQQQALALRRTLQDFWTGTHWDTNPDYPDEGEWLDDSVWSIYHGVATPAQAAAIWGRMDANVSFYEGVPTRWASFKNGHWACSWFGRLGGGDIMSRYAANHTAKGLALLERISAVIVAHGNIYEGYDMSGCGLHRCGCTTSGFGDYLEHTGGLIWVVVEAVFGVNFDSTPDYAASIQPRIPQDWPTARALLYLRGHPLNVSWAGPGRADASAVYGVADNGSAVVSGTLTLELLPTAMTPEPRPAATASVRVQVRCGAAPQVVTLAVGAPQSFSCPAEQPSGMALV